MGAPFFVFRNSREKIIITNRRVLTSLGIAGLLSTQEYEQFCMLYPDMERPKRLLILAMSNVDNLYGCRFHSF